MKFEPDNDFQKHRDAFGGVWFMQNGHKFSPGGKDLGPYTSAAEKTAAKDKKHQDVRVRAAKKLEDFSDQQNVTGTIAEALKENREAEAAEASV